MLGLGRLLKQHQRDWAFAHGVGHITWTFDPLVARNAHFNLRVLGARITEYLVDHYGAMDDGVNRGDERPADGLVGAGRPGIRPARGGRRDLGARAARHRGGAPHDPAEALEWRYRVRDAFGGLLQDGLVVIGFDDERGYLFGRG